MRRIALENRPGKMTVRQCPLAAERETAGGDGLAKIRKAASDALEVSDGCRGRGRRGEQSRRIGVTGCAKERFGFAFLDDLSRMHDDHALGELPGQRQIVGDQQASHSARAGLFKNEFEDRSLRVVSSPVVGSSAISSSGFPAMAMASMTRWHMPPESSPG